MNVGQVLEAHPATPPLGLGRPRLRHHRGRPRRRRAGARHREQDPHEHAAGAAHRHAGVRRGALGRDGGGGQAPDDQDDLREPHPESVDGNRLIQPDGKTTLYNGRTGEAYDNPITVGYVYILKLAHLVDDKIHARSTGPYSMITQQPPAVRPSSVASASARWRCGPSRPTAPPTASRSCSPSSPTTCSAVSKVYEAIVKGENIPEPGIPESFKVLIKEMQALCLNVEVLNTIGDEIEMRELDEDIFRTAEELGIDISRPERGPTKKTHARRRRAHWREDETHARRQQLRPAAIGLATADSIRTWSNGEVKKPETINYRTLKPEKDGLFCEKIFGPTKDWECYCGKYKRVPVQGHHLRALRRRGHPSKVRRERMGHIELAAPVVHIWYLRGTRSWLAYLLMGTEPREELKAKQLEKVIYFAANLVTWVDEEKRQEDLPNLEAELLAEKEPSKGARVAPGPSPGGARAEIEALENEGAKDADVKAPPAAEKDLAGIREALRRGARPGLPGLGRVQDLFPRRSSRTRCCGASSRPLRRRTSRAAWAPTPSSRHRTASTSTRKRSSSATRIDPPEGQQALSAQRKQKAIKRLKIVSAFNRRDENGSQRPAGDDPRRRAGDPAELRPMVQLDGGRFATSDLNDLYRRVINRNNRLKRLLDLGAPRSSSTTRSACCRRPSTRCSTTAAAAGRSPARATARSSRSPTC